MSVRNKQSGVLACVTTIIFLLAALWLGQGTAYAADGDLDFSFGGGDGTVTTNFHNTGDEVRAVTIQPDGKIVAVGSTQISADNHNFSVARYNPDGSPDASFGGGDGRLTTDFYQGNDAAHAVAIQADGKIVAVGSAYYPPDGRTLLAVARYNPDGSLDPDFGGGGKTWVYFGDGETSVAYGVAIQADGRTVVVGSSSVGGGSINFALARLNLDGAPDPSFGADGAFTVDFFGGIDEAHAVSINGGSIVVAGFAQVNGFNYDFALARYELDGDPDPTFGGDGKVTTDFFGGDDGALSMALQPDGKIVAAGAFYSTGQGYDFGLGRYLPNGDLDTGFDSDGLQAINFVGGNGTEVANGVALQPDGKIVAAGYAPVGGVNDFALVRLNPDGSLDNSFGTGGKVNHDFGGGVAIAYGVAVQADGRIVTGGTAYMGEPNSYDYAVARYLGGGATNPTATPIVTPTSTACAIQYTDVPPGSTFYDYVRCLACRGIVSGYPDGTYAPGNPVTRGQLSKIVSNAAGYSEPHSGQSFEDVPLGSTFYLFIERLADRGFISGYACGGPGEPCVPPANLPYFRPGASVTRGQTSKIVASAAGLPAPPPGLWTFQDVPQGSTFWEWIEELSSIAAIRGYPCGGDGEPCVAPENRYYFRPGNTVTRGQTAKIASLVYFPECGLPMGGKE